jgi:prepilin-type N-terminal cleavage/methylation domain-containing protein
MRCWIVRANVVIPVDERERSKLKLCAPGKRHAGFTLTELIVALAVGLVLMAVGLPAFMHAYHSYQLSGAATQVAGILRLTRYEAIRLNKPVNCLIQPSAANPALTNLWADSNANNQLDPTEKMILLGGAGNLVNSGVPNTSELITNAIGVGTVTTASVGSTISFDARGAVMAPPGVTVFYLTSTLAPEAGYRAVFLLPAGSIQVWTSDSVGNWQQLR